MDPNQDTVRSLATLLVTDENGDVTNVSKGSPTTNGFTPKSSDAQESLTIEAPDDMDDSVFGDVPLDDHPVRFQVKVSDTDSQALDDSKPGSPKMSSFRRQGSLRSQISMTSSHKEPVKREVKLKVFVSILFIVIVTGVSVVLHLAKNKQYEVELGKKIIVHEDTRKIRFQDQDRNDILIGDFGLGIPKHILPYDCSEDKLRNRSLCLKWRDMAEMHIDYWENDTSKCYDIGWRSLSKEILLNDCFGLDPGAHHWYGGWISAGQTWPITDVSLPLRPFITGQLHGQDTFGPVLERYWLSSKGIAIFSADLASPLHLSWNAPDMKTNSSRGDGRLCLVSDYDHPVYGSQRDREAFLKYTVCVSSNILDVHRLALQMISEKRNISVDSSPDMSLFDAPVWSAARTLQNNITQTGLEHFGKRLSKLNASVGVLMIEDQWQANHGDIDFDSRKFTDVPTLVRNLKTQLNCTLALGIDPYTSVHSKNFKDIASQEYLMTDAGGQAPGLLKLLDIPTTSNKTQLVGALDVTSESAVEWFQGKLNNLKKASFIDVFNFQGGVATLLPFGATLGGENRTNRNSYTHDYGVMAEINSQPAIVDSATHLQGHPLIVRVKIASLTQAIPTALTLGILGYPYFLLEIDTPLASKDLYIRSIQLSAFLPIMHVGLPPDSFGSEAEEVLRTMSTVHRNLVHPKVVSESVSSLNPIVRPLWWIAPGDPVARQVDSEFLIGDDLLVAPVLEEGATHRDVYLPKGTWASNRGGQPIQGPTWLKNHSVPLKDYAYFESYKKS